MKKKIILFDIDGTILNLEFGIAYNIFVDTLNEVFGIEINSENLPSFHGKTDLQILADIEREFVLEKTMLTARAGELWDLLYDRFKMNITKETIRLMPGIEQLISIFDDHDDYALGLVTGNFKQNAYLKLSVNALDKYFPVGAFGCDNENRNALPIIALNRAADSGLIPSDFSRRKALIIGDTLRDIECAKVNNIPALAVATGGISKDVLASSEPELIFDDFTHAQNVFDIIDNYLNKQI